MIPDVTVRRLYQSNGENVEFPRTGSFVRLQKMGVLMVKMRGSGSFLHAICIETGEEPGWIYDSSEPYAIKLTAESLRLFVVDASSYQYMDYFREVCRFGALDRAGKERHRLYKSTRKRMR